jgi:hypothetical protein
MKNHESIPESCKSVVRPHHSICVVHWQYLKQDNLRTGIRSGPALFKVEAIVFYVGTAVLSLKETL